MRDNLSYEANRDPYADFDEAMIGHARRLRWTVALLLMVAAALVAYASLGAHDAFAVIVDPCARYTPSDWQYWMYGCWMY